MGGHEASEELASLGDDDLLSVLDPRGYSGEIVPKVSDRGCLHCDTKRNHHADAVNEVTHWATAGESVVCRCGRSLYRGQSGQIGEIGAEIAAIDGGETIGLHTGVSGDEKVRDEVLSWPTFPPVP